MIKLAFPLVLTGITGASIGFFQTVFLAYLSQEAMALHGKNSHYKIDGIQKRHFIETAKYVQYSKIKALRIFEQVMDRVDSAIDEVSTQLPNHFPQKVAEPIFKAMKTFKERMVKI